MSLPRGFKANAEREALRLRAEMGLRQTDALDVNALATHLGVKIVSAGDLIEMSRLEEIERIQAYSFSGATFEIGGRQFVITSPLRTPGRRASDIAHELSHILLKHELSEIREIDEIPFRTCRPEEEEQATNFGGTLLLPRPLLVSAARQGLTHAEIADRYQVTIEMARFRYNSTGVGRQVGQFQRAAG
ncbi:ImmA/IrrE family metallo-endopeptidase [Parafrankia sp. FMc6]|uniref:ImmA/IrrE family metallo-endopeptidase n=1 Tax=Parafrankia soli TaxID=2599596 RepID=UPI0034D42694